MTLSIALADDQALVRRGLKAVLNDLEGITVAIEADDGESLLAQLATTAVDVVLCDIRMPRLDGISMVDRLRRGANPLPVILLTTFNDEGLLEKAIAAGANGFVLKDIEPEELVRVIQDVARGERIFMPQPTDKLRTSSSLPPGDEAIEEPDAMELAILRLMAAGLSNREIAERLHRAEGTIKNRVSVLLQKLHARDRTQAVLKAITRGLI